MKLSTEQATKLLSDLGVDAEIVEAKEADADVKIEDIAAEVTEYLKPGIVEAVKSEHEAANHAKFINTLRSGVQRTLNIPKKEMDGKTLEDILALVKTTTESKGTTEASEWKTKYETAVQDYEQQLEIANTTWETKYNTEIQAANKKYIDRDINDVYQTQVGKIARQGGDLVKQSKVLRSLIQQEGIEEVYDEANKSLVFKKDGKILKVEETLANLAKDVLPIATSTNHINPKDVKNGSVPDSGIVQKTTFDELPTKDAGAKIYEWASKAE